MENLFIILRLVRQYKLGRKGRGSSRPGPGPAVTGQSRRGRVRAAASVMLVTIYAGANDAPEDS